MNLPAPFHMLASSTSASMVLVMGCGDQSERKRCETVPWEASKSLSRTVRSIADMLQEDGWTGKLKTGGAFGRPGSNFV
eukprot:2663276-Prymnesium_polylepis.1